MTAVLAEPVPVEQEVQAEACAGRRKDAAGAWQPCPSHATFEALRTCHGITQRDAICADHAGVLAARERTRCRSCRSYVAVLVALLPTGGAA